MAATTICSDFGAPQNKVSHCFHCFPIYLPGHQTPNFTTLCRTAFSMVVSRNMNHILDNGSTTGFLTFRMTSLKDAMVLLVLQFSSVQLLSHVRLFATPWIAARQASLSITNSWSSLKLKSIELVMPSSHLILRPPIPPSIRVFSNESSLRMRWPKY